MINFRKVRTFEGGYSTDTTENVERKNTYQKAIGGRLYSKNGVFSFSGGAGSKLIYQNSSLVKYLGFYSFSDEFIVFAKCLKSTSTGGAGTTAVCNSILTARGFTVSQLASGTDIQFTNEITTHTSATERCVDITTPALDPISFQEPSCDSAAAIDIDISNYYSVNHNVPNNILCNFSGNTIPINNLEYDDCILSFKLDDSYNLVSNLLWVGHQNWPFDGKITTDGVEENQFYKRVYYTDAVNAKKVVNLKDPYLSTRKPEEFNQVLNNILLEPEIIEVTTGGQLNTMKVLYLYRAISLNGQLSEFSPTSKFARIHPEENPIGFKGGDTSELTNKRVRVKCNLLNINSISEIECVAIEYEAFGPPTKISNLGRKTAAAIVEFEHYGNEPEFSDNITYGDIINHKNTWKYCNDFSSKKNKLIAVGLRNDPISSEISELEHKFALHSWDANGNTHECLMNPEPWNYKYIDPSYVGEIIYIKERYYKQMYSFGPAQITLRNTTTGDNLNLMIPGLSFNHYTDILQQVNAWLLSEYNTNVLFNIKFPNLEINVIQEKLLFTQLNPLLETDFSNYVIESNNSQFVSDYDNNIVFLNTAINTNNLVRGAQSIGFNSGDGIRITYREFKEPLLKQATEVYDGSGKILDYFKPSFEKYFMKGEIYRLAFQAFDNDSTSLFSIPLGDLMIPELNSLKSFVDDAGNAVITSQKYVNQSVENGILYGHGIKMHIEVRLNCSIQKSIPMYKILYVERNEDNRTILCQGIAAPLTRVQTNGKPRHQMPDEVKNKWNLPYYGGPTYDKQGLLIYDLYGNNHQYTGDGPSERIITSRNLMYFDSPDLYFNKISNRYIKNSKLDVVAKLNTDHTSNVIRERGGLIVGGGTEIYPKFSRKILEHQLEGENHSLNLPAYNIDERRTGSHLTHFINISVFSNYQPYNGSLNIDKNSNIKYGEVISGNALGVSNAISNNTFSLPNQPWYYSIFARKWEYTNNDPTRPKCDVFSAAMVSPGYDTEIIKTQENLFTIDFNRQPLPRVDMQIRDISGSFSDVYDTIPLININRNNKEAVYGGRTKEAYSKNVYIPLSKTIPTLKESNDAQIFNLGGDTFISLNIRQKNGYGKTPVLFRKLHHDGGGRRKGALDTWTRNGAWVYVCVLETQVEPKETYQYEFYRNVGTHSFEKLRPEIINKAYFNEDTLKSYIPKPFKYKDDPNRGSVIAVSDVKVAGEYYDSWTVFKTNNFYPLLEKNKGDISNIVKDKENIYVIQKEQTSLIYIGTDRIVKDTNGTPINIQQGSGTVVDGHKVVSNFGTGIRRAATESYYGFTFFDETKIEFVRNGAPLLIKNFLHIDYFNKFKKNKIVDTESYYDVQNKETCVRIRTASKDNFMLSYNELFQVFNGEFPYDNDLYINFKEKLYTPIRTLDNNSILSKDLHELNEGDILNFFNVQTDMILGLIINADMDKVFQYKQFGIVTNIDYPINHVKGKSSLGYDRTILGNHNWYKIREGTHTVPLVNESNDPAEYADVRGAWVYLEISVASVNKNKVDILAVLNDLRYSHQ